VLAKEAEDLRVRAEAHAETLRVHAEAQATHLASQAEVLKETYLTDEVNEHSDEAKAEQIRCAPRALEVLDIAEILDLFSAPRIVRVSRILVALYP